MADESVQASPEEAPKVEKEKTVELNVAAEASFETKEVPVAASEVSKGERQLAVLGYFGVFCILTLLLKPESKFCQLHGKQALVLAIAGTLFGIMKYWGAMAASAWIFFFGGVAVYGMYLAWKGESKEIPMLGEIAKTIKF